MTKQIGPTFGDELRAAGLQNKVASFVIGGTDADIVYAPGISAQDRSAVDAVIAAHDPVKPALIAYAAAKRWAKETGGITLPNEVEVATDTVAQTKIAAAKTAFDNGTITGSIEFKAVNGWFTVDAATMTQVYAAVVAHVQGCYVQEKAAVDGINAGTITTTAQVDAEFT